MKTLDRKKSKPQKPKKDSNLTKIKSGITSWFKFQTSIKAKLMLVLLLISICSMVTIAFLSYESGKSGLTERIFDQLTGLRSAKVQQLEGYFENLRNEAETLSEDLMVINAMNEFKDAYNRLEKESKTLPPDLAENLDKYYRENYLPTIAKIYPESINPDLYKAKSLTSAYLQSYYIATNPHPQNQKYLLDDAGEGSEYSRVHQKYHPLLRQLLERFGYSDILLIDAETGNCVYTYNKNVDFATNIFDGPFNKTNLRDAVVGAIESKARNYTKIVDFQRYLPALGKPLAFIAAPIFNQSDLIGVLALQISSKEITRIVNANFNWRQEGLGETGKIDVVGTDFSLRNDPRVFVANPELFFQLLEQHKAPKDLIEKSKAANTPILILQLQTESTQKAVEGITGTKIIEDTRGQKVLSSFSRVQIEGLQWGIVAEMDLDEAFTSVYALQKVVVTSGVFIAVLIAVVSIVISGILSKPINILIANARKITRGELDAVVQLKKGDEFGELAKAFNTMVVSLQEQTGIAEQKNQENQDLLNSVFPPAIAQRLKNKEKDIGDRLPDVAILFADIIGFSKLYQSLPPEEVLTILNDLVNRFDETNDKYGVAKVKTIGDNYIAACGLCGFTTDRQQKMVDFALEMQSIVSNFSQEKGFSLDISIAIDFGEVMAGVVGRRKFTYDVWGVPVSIANAILASSFSQPGTILVSQAVRDKLSDIYYFEEAGYLETGKDKKLLVWLLKSAAK